jgi:hypothetical protein
MIENRVESSYLSPHAPRWTPRTEADLDDAIQQGLLEETHHLELKREIATGRNANKELARDLASFAVDGGTYIIGIEEDKRHNTMRLSPQPLSGLAERIEQVARMIPDPPLAVLCRSISSTQDPSCGYLIVHVPRSGTAPHMVEHKYLGRGDKTKQYLSDSEVRRLHELRRHTEQDGLARLQDQFDRDPVPADVRKQAHLFLLAEPVAGRPGMLLDIVHGDRNWLYELVDDAASLDITKIFWNVGVGQFSPALRNASDFALRSAGVAFTSRLASDRTPAATGGDFDEDIVEIEIDEDGGLRIFMGRLSDSRADRLADPAGGRQQIFPSAVITYTRQFIALTRAAAEHAGYLGTWILAAGATGIQGLPVHDYVLRGNPSPHYDAADYRRATIASYAELLHQPGTTTERLAGRLLRALGMHDKYVNVLTDPVAPGSQTP